MSLVIPFPDDLVDQLADRLEERLQERRRWANIEQTADHLGLTVRQVQGLRERGLPAHNNRPLIFDLREVDEWMERR
jgi:hypothetical protein